MKHLLIILAIGAIGVGLFYRSAINPAQGTPKSSAEIADSAEDPKQPADPQETTTDGDHGQSPKTSTPERSVANETSDNEGSARSADETTVESGTEILGDVLQRIDKTGNNAAQPTPKTRTEEQTAKDQASLEILEGLMRNFNTSDQ